jgi:hypothetical protein
MTAIRYPDKRQVGESYRDYANRMEGAARAAEQDRSQLAAYVMELQDQRNAVLAIHHPEQTRYASGRTATTCAECLIGDAEGGADWPCPTARALGVTS